MFLLELPRVLKVLPSLRPGHTLRRCTSSQAPTPKTAPEQLAGTAPAHRCYVFLHTRQPPSTYPAKYTTPVHRQLLSAIAPWGGIVNFAWPASHPLEPEGDPETYRLTAFSNGRGKLDLEDVSLANIDAIADVLRTHTEAPLASPREEGAIHLYVCTHGARDCRCGEMGGAVARRIRAELEARKQRQAFDADPRARVRWHLAEVAHVGGHQYAGNVLVYPHGEWLGNVRPENVSEILDTILARPVRPMRAEEMPICPTHWRGRMGLSREEQMALFKRFSDAP